MELVTVESSMIHAVGYDRQKRILEIVFNTGRAYQYYDVPLKIHGELLKAESKGRYFLANIRDMYEYAPLSRSRR
ncbi:MAG: KTSC domain-containing protein [Chloroflexi bacterium]|nr:KTSC domain-containing protein [Chloroflexota bacterium]